jgi:hypothetical protein
MTLRLNGSTSGYVEIDAPDEAGSNTLILPDGNGTSGQALQTNGSGALSWGPGVASNAQLCKAWVNFNGTGTVAIRASYNVSSITDNGTGDYTVNFTTALADANYSIAVASNRSTGWNATTGTLATSSAIVATFNGLGNNEDSSTVSVAIFR